MKILHVLCGDAMGGCERLSLDLAAYHAEQGHEQIALFYGDAGSGPAWTQFEALGAVPFRVRYEGRPFEFVNRVRRLCHQQKVKAVLTHGLGMHLLIALGARLGGARRVFALVGNPPPISTSLTRRIRVRVQFARPLVTQEIACSNYVKVLMCRSYWLPRRRVIVVPNGCRVGAISARAEVARTRWRDERAVDGSPSLVLLMVARLDPIKDHATVIQAMPALRELYPGILLRIVGDGVMMAPLRKMVRDLGMEEAVEFLGAREDVPEQLGAADVFVYSTTRDEGFGIVLIEAMAAGIPIVCSDIGPCAEVLDGGLAGLMFEPGSSRGIVAAIDRLQQEPGLGIELVERGRKLARERYSHQATGKQILRLIGTGGAETYRSGSRGIAG